MNNLDVSNRIKILCKQKKMPIKILLEHTNINRNFIYDLERKEIAPAADKLEHIADYLDCSVDYLLGRTDNPISHKNFNSDSLDILDLESLAQELTNRQSAAE